jgi:prophage antirepressor-like protein
MKGEYMNNLIPFNYNSKEVRTINKDGEPWFVAKDVCEILEISDTWSATSRLSESMKGTDSISTLGGTQEMSVINEAGLYKLVFTSRKPEAEKFTDWVATDVIPSIRKHGMYAKDELLDNPDLLIEVVTQLKKEREEKRLLQAENKLLTGQTLAWADRKILEAIVKAYGASINLPEVNGFQEAWRDFKKELLYNYGINLNSRISKQMENSHRKTKPKTMDMIHDDELSKCISTAVALCKSHCVDISDIISKRAS